jgi:hypothetical protein
MLAAIAQPILAQLAGQFFGNLFSGKKQAPQEPIVPQLTMAQAQQQAGDMVNPLYDRQLQPMMQGLTNQNLSRGFYGQLPGDMQTMGRMQDFEMDRAGQIANLTQQIMAQNQQLGLQQQGMQHQVGLANQQMRQQLGSNFLGGMYGYQEGTNNWWMPGSGGQTLIPGQTNNRSLDVLKNANLSTPAGIGKTGSTFGESPNNPYSQKMKF